MRLNANTDMTSATTRPLAALPSPAGSLLIVEVMTWIRNRPRVNVSAIAAVATMSRRSWGESRLMDVDAPIWAHSHVVAWPAAWPNQSAMLENASLATAPGSLAI